MQDKIIKLTNKEAIAYFKRHLDLYCVEGISREAEEMAIKALEQEPCEDAISREQAIRATYGFERYTGIDEAPYEYTENILRDLPPVTPQYTDVEIQKMQEMEQAETQKAYELGKEDKIKVLDKIRAEIESHCGLIKENHCRYCSYCNSVMGVREILEIIDKYKESEG